MTYRSLLAICLVLLMTPSVFAARTVVRANPDDSSTTKAMAVIEIHGEIEEMLDPVFFFGPKPQVLRDIVTTIDRAADDENIAGLVVKLDDPLMGAAQAVELHDALLRFRESNKPIIAMLDRGDLLDYHVASAADHIVMTPVGTLMVYGVAAHLYYFETLMDKLGIDAQVVARGQFKTALEPFVRPDMSEATRIQITALIEEYSYYFLEATAAARDMTIDEARDSLWGGPYTSTAALEAGLVTDVAYYEQYLDDYAAENAIVYDEEYSKNSEKATQPFDLFSILAGSRNNNNNNGGKSNQIALLYATGPIVDGRAMQNPLAFKQVVASEDFIELIDEAIEEGARAIVLRIDSPGGSAVASDRIWNRLETAQSNGIPVVVSMGNLAASGGYYIAMGADKIFVEPTTITGSIGVIFGRVVLGGTYNKIGLNKEMVTVGPHAGIVDERRPWNEQELQLIETLIDEMYDTFVSKAARGRNMPHERMAELAQGRVWTGIAATDNGLADELGGLDAAIASARELAAVPGAPVTVYPKEMTLMEMIEKALSGEVQAPAPNITSPQPALAQMIGELLPRRQAKVLWTTLELLRGNEMTILMYDPAPFEIR